MKTLFKYLSVSAIIGFGVLLILEMARIDFPLNSSETRNMLVVVYLFTSLRYHKMELKEKNTEIRKLKASFQSKEMR